MEGGEGFCSECDTILQYIRRLNTSTKPFCNNCRSYVDDERRPIKKNYLESNGRKYRVPEVLSDRIYVFSKYVPTRKNYGHLMSYLILSFKSGSKNVINHFFSLLQDWIERQKIEEDILVCRVPSHDPNNSSPIDHIITRLSDQNQRLIDGKDILVRTRKIQKQSYETVRKLETHESSIRVRGNIYTQTVLLIDDILTSGNSMIACKRKLINAGALIVFCIVFGRTE